MTSETYPATPNIHREAASARANLRATARYLETAISAARCGGQDTAELKQFHLRTIQLYADLLIWRNKHDGLQAQRAAHGNGGQS